MTQPHRTQMQARWQALTAGDRPTLSPALSMVPHTFLDPAFPDLAVPSEALLNLFEMRALYLPRLDWLALVALAALSHRPLSHPQERACRLVQDLSRLFAETAFAVGGEQHVTPAVHYRPGVLRRCRPSALSDENLHQLEVSYRSGLEVIDLWLARTPQSDSVLAHRLPTLATPLDVIAQRLPAGLTPLTDLLRARQDSLAYNQALTLLCDEALTMDVPWAVPFLTWVADLAPSTVSRPWWLEEMKMAHAELLVRWHLAGCPPTLADLPPYTQADEQLTGVKTHRKISQALQEAADAQPKALWRQLTALPYCGQTRGWARLEGKAEPRLLRLCEKVIPSDAVIMGVPEKILDFLTDRPHGKNFLTRLTLMAVSLMAEKRVQPSTILDYLRTVDRYFHMIFAHGETTPEQFDPNLQLLAFFKSAGTCVGLDPLQPRELTKLDTRYAGCNRALTEFISAHPADADWLSTYSYGPVVDEPIQKLRKGWYLHDTGERVLNGDHSAVVDHVRQLMVLAESRYVLIRELMLLVREVQRDSRRAGKAYPWTVDFPVPETDVIWHFQLWTAETFAQLHVPAGEPVAVPRDDSEFLEYLGTETRGDTDAEHPWCFEYLKLRTRTEAERVDYLKNNGERESTFSNWRSFQNTPSRPHEITKLIKKVIQAGAEHEFDQRFYVYPDDLYMEVLTAILLLRFSRTTGSRLHEFLQLRKDQIKERKPDVAKPGHDPNIADVQQSKAVWVAHLSPKGWKGQPGQKDRMTNVYLSESVLRIIRTIIELRVRVEGKVAHVAPVNNAVLHQGKGPYLIQNGKRVLSQQEIARRARFLLLGWQEYTESSTGARFKSHALRYAFAHGMVEGGFDLEQLRQLLNQARDAMAERYAAPTQSQAQLPDDLLLMPLETQHEQPVGLRPGVRVPRRAKADQVKPPGILQRLYDREGELIMLERAFSKGQE